MLFANLLTPRKDRESKAAGKENSVKECPQSLQTKEPAHPQLKLPNEENIYGQQKISPPPGVEEEARQLEAQPLDGDSADVQPMMKIEPIPYLCRNCGKHSIDESGKVKMCSRCRKATYCSVDCQIKHWSSEHHIECMAEEKGEGKKVTQMNGSGVDCNKLDEKTILRCKYFVCSCQNEHNGVEKIDVKTLLDQLSTLEKENMFLKEKLALFNEEASPVESEQRREGVEEKVVRNETLRRKHTATTNVPNDMKMAAARAYIDGLLNQDITGKTKSKMINLHTVSTAGI